MPVNNSGLVAFSMNRGRFSAECLEAHPDDFTLSVPCKGMEELVLAVGKRSGRRGGKFTHLAKDGARKLTIEEDGVPVRGSQPLATRGNPFASLGQSDSSGDEEQGQLPDISRTNFAAKGQSSDSKTEACVAVMGCVAWLRLTVVRRDCCDDEHYLFLVQVKAAAVHSDYWDGRVFAPTRSDVPPFLTFLGAQRFAYTVATTDRCPSRLTSDADESVGPGAPTAGLPEANLSKPSSEGAAPAKKKRP